MSYHFEIDGGPSFDMNVSEMGLMREFMREVGAIVDSRARSMDEPGVDPQAAPIALFQSNSGQRVSAAQSAIIAHRLTEHFGVVREVASFFDDAPAGGALRTWVEAWAAFNAQGAAHGGYRVS